MPAYEEGQGLARGGGHPGDPKTGPKAVQSAAGYLHDPEGVKGRCQGAHGQEGVSHRDEQ